MFLPQERNDSYVHDRGVSAMVVITLQSIDVSHQHIAHLELNVHINYISKRIHEKVEKELRSLV